MELPKLSGDEPLVTKLAQARVLDFWRWSASRLLDNTLRGIFAEWLVGVALGAVDDVRKEWAPFDLTASGINVEVKSSAYVQAWAQTKPSRPSFTIASTRGWTPIEGYDEQPSRQSDVYVFALLAHEDRATVDPLNVSQWTFWVVATEHINKELGDQKSLGLARLKQLAGEGIPFGQLRETVEADWPHRVARGERLRKLTRWGTEIPNALATLHEAHGPHIHLRPTSNGVTLLGLTPGRPQRGKGGFTDLAALVTDFAGIFEKHCRPDEHGRDTPEKELQSALIRDAYLHKREMRLFAAATANTNDAATPIFIADEMALPTEEGRIVCDLFCARERPDGSLQPMIIELKSAREKKTLIKQVEGYAGLVGEQLAGFQALTRAVLGRAVILRGPCERWIVWPALGSGPDKHAADLGERGIRLVTYVEKDGEFTLSAVDFP